MPIITVERKKKKKNNNNMATMTVVVVLCDERREKTTRGNQKKETTARWPVIIIIISGLMRFILISNAGEKKMAALAACRVCVLRSRMREIGDARFTIPEPPPIFFFFLRPFGRHQEYQTTTPENDIQLHT
jgi:hypothetical protein